ncbi:hypothetical protein D3C74_298770 [compost metagenome]
MSYAYKYGEPGMSFFLAHESDVSKSIVHLINIGGIPDREFIVSGLCVNLVQGVAYITGKENYYDYVDTVKPIDNRYYDPSKPLKLVAHLRNNIGGNPYLMWVQGKLLYS